MAFDVGDWKRAMDARGARRRDAEIAPLSLIKMAAVQMDKLVGHEAWDSYVRMLQARLEDLEGAQAAIRESLASPLLIDHGEIMAMKLRYATNAGALDALSLAMQLPREIIAGAQKADASG